MPVRLTRRTWKMLSLQWTLSIIIPWRTNAQMSLGHSLTELNHFSWANLRSAKSRLSARTISSDFRIRKIQQSTDMDCLKPCFSRHKCTALLWNEQNASKCTLICILYFHLSLVAYIKFAVHQNVHGIYHQHHFVLLFFSIAIDRMSDRSKLISTLFFLLRTSQRSSVALRAPKGPPLMPKLQRSPATVLQLVPLPVCTVPW